MVELPSRMVTQKKDGRPERGRPSFVLPDESRAYRPLSGVHGTGNRRASHSAAGMIMFG